MSSISLADHVRRYAALTPDDELRLLTAVEKRRLEKREHVFEAGKPARVLAYVESGLLRLYAIDETKERTLQFALEGWWIADWDAFERGVPASGSLQAIEESRVVLVPLDRYESLLADVPSMERYFRRIWQRAYAASQRRHYPIDTESAELRYRNFQRAYPEFVQRVPQYMLASFLNMTPEFLSRIRARS